MSSDATHDVKISSQPGSARAETSFEELIYRQDLNEVYLLLDFISGRPDKRLSDLDNKISDPHSNNADKMSSAEIIARVSELRYPPDRPAGERATDAAFLLELKDLLNWMAQPARGLTIAYTTMFTEGSRGFGHMIWNGVAGILGRQRSETATPTRVQMAQRAFPGLIAIAANFRLMRGALSIVGLFLGLLSAFCLWQATYGVHLADQFSQAQRNGNEVIAKLFNLLEKEGRATQVAQWPGGLYDLCTSSSEAPKVFASAEEPTRQEIVPNGMNPIMRQLCNEYAYQQAIYTVLIQDLQKYSDTPIYKYFTMLFPIHEVAKSGRQEDYPSVRAMLSMMTTYLLPILFGVVGTIVALLRGIQHRVNESTLAPRDLALLLFRLVLGMMAGIAVGLFLTPSTIVAQTGGGVATLTLSASGIAFLAGYGAEGFFRMLDAFVAHLFNLDRSQPQRSLR
jgi:hypothetical protein